MIANKRAFLKAQKTVSNNSRKVDDLYTVANYQVIKVDYCRLFVLVINL